VAKARFWSGFLVAAAGRCSGVCFLCVRGAGACWSMRLWNALTVLPVCYCCYRHSQARPPKSGLKKIITGSESKAPFSGYHQCQSTLLLRNYYSHQSPLWHEHGFLQCVPLHNYNLFYFLPRIRLLSSEHGLTGEPVAVAGAGGWKGLEGDDAVCLKTGLIFVRHLFEISYIFLENFSANEIAGFDW
jgi:hypothetical protein